MTKSNMLTPNKQYTILGIGSPCADILLNVEEDVIERYGVKKGGNKSIDYPTLVKIMQEYHGIPNFRPGGSCCNTIKGLANLGHECAIVGKIGDDEIGEAFIHNFSLSNIRPLFAITKTPTAQVACLITPEKQRTFLCFNGAEGELHENNLQEEHFKGVSLVHIEGYAITKGNVVQKAMSLAKNANALVSYDLGCFPIVENHKDTLTALIKSHVDILFANEDEARALTGEEPENAVDQLLKLSDTVVILLGKKGCIAANKKEKYYCPALEVPVVDTTGAGDLFASGFLHGYLCGYSLENCAKLGNLLGASIVEECGAQIPESKWASIKQAISQILQQSHIAHHP